MNKNEFENQNNPQSDEEYKKSYIEFNSQQEPESERQNRPETINPDPDPMENRYEKKSNKKWKGFFPAVSGAVIGSVATLYLAPVLGLTVPLTDATSSTPKTEAVEKTSGKALSLQPASTSASSMMQAIEKVTPAVVGVVNMRKQQSNPFQDPFGQSQNQGQDQDAGTGSGVIFKKSGNTAYIVTNNHVVEEANKIEVALQSGERVPAELVGADPLTDLAVIKIDSKYATVVASFGDSSSLKLGEQVAAIGNPLGLNLSSSVTQGIVSGTERSIPVSTSAGQWELNVIQTDAAINPGNSGGALINSSGQVVGINSLKIAESGVEGLGFAIPSKDLQPIIEDLMEYGQVNRPYLGVGLQDVSNLSDYIKQELNLPGDVKDGAVITQIEPSSSASAAGLKVKDVIVSMNDEKIGSVGELRKYLYSHTKAGDSIKIGIYRDGKKETVTLKLRQQGV